MDSHPNVLYAAGLPALISTGITLIYFLLKACRFAFYALSHKTKGRLAATTPGSGQQEHGPIEGKEGHTEVYEQNQEILQNSMAQGPNDPQGPFLYQEDGKTYASLPVGMLQNIQRSPLFDKMKKDCQAEGVEIPKTIMAKDPAAHMITPQEYLQKVAAGLMPQMDNHQMMKELAEKNDQTKILMMEFRDIECPKDK